jgi:O-antigen/teichoic acid export membrane protein
MALIYNKADHMILSWLKGDYTLGQYAACYRLMGALMGFVLIGTAVFIPRAAEVSSKTPERFSLLLHKGLLMITVISLPVSAGAFCLSNSIVSLILGPKYLESEWIFRALTLVIPFGVSASFFCGSLLFATGHQRQYARAAMIGAIINMVFNVLLIPSMGALGAAVATISAQGVVTGAAIYMGRQYLDKVFSRSLLHPIVASIAMVLTLTVVFPFGSNVILRFICGSLTYIITLWILDTRDGQELRGLLLSSILPRKAPSITV